MNNKRVFRQCADALDPAMVPQRKLSNGATIPALGIGTFGSDRFSAEDIADSVLNALEIGYRLVDCASCYYNEAEIGTAFRAAFDAGLKREDVFVTSKLWNDKHKPEEVIPQIRQSIEDLQTDYIDCYFIHWPFANYHEPGCDVTSRAPNATPYDHKRLMSVYRELEKAVDMGLIRSIGTSNWTIPKMKLLLRDCRIRPVLNELELHPHFQQQEFFDYLLREGIQPIGFCPIGSPTRPDRDKTESDTCDIEDPVIVKIAKDHGVHPAVICLKWAVKRGQIPIPFSIYRDQVLSNLAAAIYDPLTDEEMAAISRINKNCRLIKGQVFLWKDNQDWKDLWDEDGVIVDGRNLD